MVLYYQTSTGPFHYLRKGNNHNPESLERDPPEGIAKNP